MRTAAGCNQQINSGLVLTFLGVVPEAEKGMLATLSGLE